ncbi:MAG: MCE family protein [Hydrogenophaga sp.]|jgi:paraquat-inducible protein B|uniref:MlaD family protein n=1 Tax=Hydrogenophaga sp. TaxID=1904254 RepID=UPI001DBA704B|nr:MlaD family protein [Hydrogenophaga sp.]MBW0172645.1 MCE family protein [Hydrogenophaga sp.]MBW0186360.1 MCE family protein [Hydrogenophaga sp.]
MKRKANPTLIGTFVVAGIALIAIAIITLAGSNYFTRKERTVMYFSGSVYGLQVGAPVVFRGVRVGSVESIEVSYDRNADAFSIPVVAVLDSDAVRGLDGKRSDADEPGLALPALVERGLSAQLSMQSLLTGLLYVDLDLRPKRTASTRNVPRGLIEIPTTATAIQNLRDQVEGIDLRKITDDLAAIAASARAVISGPQLNQALSDLAEITATVKRVSERLDKRLDPMAEELQRSLKSTTSAMGSLDKAARSVDQTAAGVGRTSERVSDLLAPDAPLVQNLQRAANEVSRTAGALREATAGDSQLMVGADRALDDLSRAARALRDLAEALEQQPDALLRGRKVNE